MLIPILLICGIAVSCKNPFQKASPDPVSNSIHVLYDESKADNRKEGGFCSDRMLDEDTGNIFAISLGDKTDPGVLIKVPKSGEPSSQICILQAAIERGYTDSTAYYPDTVSVFGKDVLVIAMADVGNPRIELFDFDAANLSLNWRWDSGYQYAHNYEAPAKWNNEYVVLGSDSDHLAVFIINSVGELIAKRLFDGGWATIIGPPLIIGNQLYLRQKTNPVVALDLAKICNTSSSEKDCITYTEAGGENDLPSSIVGDSTHYYLDAAYGSGFSFEARNINDNTIAWTFTYASGFSEVNAPLTLYSGKLFIPANYGYVYCLAPTTGNLLWQTDVRPSNELDNLCSQGCVVNNKWYCQPNASSGQILAIDISSGQIVSHVPFNSGSCGYVCFSDSSYLYGAENLQIVRISFD